MTTMPAPTTPVRPVEVEEFLTGDFPVGSELVDGVVHLNDPAFLHQEVVSRLLQALAAWTRTEPGHGRAGFGGNWVLAGRNVYKPDVWWAAEPPRGTRHAGPPELAVEVRSPGTWALDVGPKLRRYEAAGTAELWLVDPPAWTVLVFRRAAGSGTAGSGTAGAGAAGFGTALEVAGGDLTSPLLPGFALPVTDLVEDAG
ncbi:Uma2 family endonuclease [Pseudonocardia kongjuensis]|uniref:Uma2 family endonuclease n=2 Tax=Pseudonocardia kongjuensis TaxID=102227 RepID=A0ABN1Y8S2_9PSEU